MELNLCILTTRQRLSWHGLHVLSGGGLKVALFAPGPDGWRLHPLTTTPMSVNGQVITSGTVINPGDRLTIGGKELFVESLSVKVDPVGDSGPAPPCQVRCEGMQIVATDELLIGTSPRCGLNLHPESGLEPLHVLLAPVGSRWFLHPLTRESLGPVQGIRPVSVEVEDGLSVQLGNVEVTFSLSDEIAPDSDSGEYNSDTDTHIPEPSGIHPIATQEGAVDPLFEKAGLLCAYVVEGSVRPPIGEPPGQGGFWARMRGEEPPEVTLHRLHDQLARNPTSVSLILSLASFLETMDYLDLCRKVLFRVCLLAPQDAEVRESMARLCCRQGDDGSRPLARRVKDYETAAQLVKEILRRRPGAVDLVELRDQIDAELTILRSGLEQLRVEKPQS